MSGEALLDQCLAAHGGLDRWRQFEAIDVDVTTGGLAFAAHVQPSLRTTARVATREPLVALSPYRRWPRGVFQRDRVFIEDASGRVMAERKNPRARMGRGRRLLWWDPLDTLYFVGYALSNYVRSPFLFCQGGFRVASAGVATFGSETWAKLRVTFPPDEPTNMAATMGVQTDEAARSTATNVLRRPLRVEKTAATVAWVASDLASGVAGQVVNVCAGAIVSR